MADLIAFETEDGTPLVYHAWSQCTLLEEYEMSDKPSHSGGSTSELLRKMPVTVSGRIDCADGLTVPSTDSPTGNIQLKSKEEQRDAIRALQGTLVTVTARSLPAEGVTGILRSIRVEDVVNADNHFIVSFEVREVGEGDLFDFDSVEDALIEVPANDDSSAVSDETEVQRVVAPSTSIPITTDHFYLDLTKAAKTATFPYNITSTIKENNPQLAVFGEDFIQTFGNRTNGKTFRVNRLHSVTIPKALAEASSSFTFQFTLGAGGPKYDARMLFNKGAVGPLGYYTLSIKLAEEEFKRPFPRFPVSLGTRAHGRLGREVIEGRSLDDGLGNRTALIMVHDPVFHLRGTSVITPKAIRSGNYKLAFFMGDFI